MVDLFQTSHPIGKHDILALDIATTTGWAMHSASGVWKLTLKKDESKGMRLIRFRSKLVELYSLHKFRLVVFEALAIYTKFPNFVAAEMQGVLKLFCTENNIDYKAYTVAEVKKFATGNGNASKDKMIAACRANYGVEPEDDNHADALHVYHLALVDLMISKL